MRLSLLGLMCALLLGGCGAEASARAEVAAASTGIATPAASTAMPVEVTATPTPAPATATLMPPPAPQAAPVVQVVVLQAPKDPTTITPLSRTSGDRIRTVVIDPGHAEDEVGAAASGVVEKHSNLEMAFRVEALLAAQGVRVILTRRADERAYTGQAISGFSATRRDLQARIDLANDSRADLFISIHSNGSLSGADRGVETYYNSQRPFSDQNRMLAATLQSSVVSEMADAGYPAVDRGHKADTCLRAFQGRCFPLFVLGPARVTTRDEVIQRGGSLDTLGFTTVQTATTSRATEMPGALVELLFVSSPEDAALLRGEDSRAALARGVARGILEFLRTTPPRAG